MDEAKQAALDLIADQQDALDRLKKMYDDKAAEAEGLADQLRMAGAAPDELGAALAERVAWFNTFRDVVWPAPAAPASPPDQPQV